MRKRIILSICALLVMMLLIISTVIYIKSASILNENSTIQMKTQLQRAKENIELRLRITKLETEKLSIDEKSILFFEGKIKTEKINEYLTDKMKELDADEGYYKDLFLIDNEGIIRATTMKEAQDIDLSMRSYLRESQDTLMTVTSDALIARSDGSIIVNTVSPIYSTNGLVLGHAGIAIKAEYFSKIVNDLKLGDAGYYGIVDSNNRVLAHPRSELIYKELPINISTHFDSREGKRIEKNPSIFEDNLLTYESYEYIDSNRWYLIATLPDDEMYKESFTLLSYVFLIGIFSIFVAILIGYYLGNAISIPIAAATEALGSITSSQMRIEGIVRKSLGDFEGRKIYKNEYDKSENEIERPDEINNLRLTIDGIREYVASITGFFEIESKKLIDQSRELTKAIDDFGFNTAKFIATLSHDLKTSITLIKGYAKGLHMGITDDEDTRNKFLAGIISSAEDIERITYDILDNAYEAQCVPKLNISTVKKDELIDEIIIWSRNYLKEKERELELKLEELPNNLGFKVDLIKIKRAWQNLMDNAVKYSYDKSKIVISVKLAPDEKKIRFSITDFGSGVNPQIIDKLQKMFYRGEESDKKGYGLGLFIVSSILEAHDTSLRIESERNNGTRVSFDLATFSID